MSDTFSKLMCHIVFSTKDRMPLITREFRDGMHAYMGGIIRGEGAVPIEIGGTTDHAHLLITVPTRVAIANLVRVVKSKTSAWINKRNSATKFAWQSGYSAFSVSESQAARVQKYVQCQEEHHEHKPFGREMVELLSKHGIRFEAERLFGKTGSAE